MNDKELSVHIEYIKGMLEDISNNGCKHRPLQESKISIALKLSWLAIAVALGVMGIKISGVL